MQGTLKSVLFKAAKICIRAASTTLNESRPGATLGLRKAEPVKAQSWRMDSEDTPGVDRGMETETKLEPELGSSPTEAPIGSFPLAADVSGRSRESSEESDRRLDSAGLGLVRRRVTDIEQAHESEVRNLRTDLQDRDTKIRELKEELLRSNPGGLKLDEALPEKAFSAPPDGATTESLRTELSAWLQASAAKVHDTHLEEIHFLRGLRVRGDAREDELTRSLREAEKERDALKVQVELLRGEQDRRREVESMDVELCRARQDFEEMQRALLSEVQAERDSLKAELEQRKAQPPPDSGLAVTVANDRSASWAIEQGDEGLSEREQEMMAMCNSLMQELAELKVASSAALTEERRRQRDLALERDTLLFKMEELKAAADMGLLAEGQVRQQQLAAERDALMGAMELLKAQHLKTVEKKSAEIARVVQEMEVMHSKLVREARAESTAELLRTQQELRVVRQAGQQLVGERDAELAQLRDEMAVTGSSWRDAVEAMEEERDALRIKVEELGQALDAKAVAAGGADEGREQVVQERDALKHEAARLAKRVGELEGMKVATLCVQQRNMAVEEVLHDVKEAAAEDEDRQALKQVVERLKLTHMRVVEQHEREISHLRQERDEAETVQHEAEEEAAYLRQEKARLLEEKSRLLEQQQLEQQQQQQHAQQLEKQQQQQQHVTHVETPPETKTLLLKLSKMKRGLAEAEEKKAELAEQLQDVVKREEAGKRELGRMREHTKLQMREKTSELKKLRAEVDAAAAEHAEVQAELEEDLENVVRELQDEKAVRDNAIIERDEKLRLVWVEMSEAAGEHHRAKLDLEEERDNLKREVQWLQERQVPWRQEPCAPGEEAAQTEAPGSNGAAEAQESPTRPPPANYTHGTLRQLAWEGATERVQQLLTIGVNPNADGERDVALHTPLHQATLNGHAATVAILLEAGADKEARDSHLNTSLHYAANHGHVEAADVLIRAGANTEARNNFEDTPLHRAARSGHVETVQALLRAGAQKEAQNNSLNTPLHWAVLFAQVDTVKVLIHAGADRSARNNADLTPLDVIPGSAASELATLLRATLLSRLSWRGKRRSSIKARAARLPKRDPPADYKHGVLRELCRSGATEQVKVLLDEGVHPNSEAERDEHFYMPLHCAAHNGHSLTVKALLEKGAEKDDRTKNLNTPLHLAALNGHTETAFALLKVGADLESKTMDYEYTPLHYAAHYGHTATVKLLLEHGASQHSVAKGGLTPLQVSRSEDVNQLLSTYVAS
ncbi:hypothetical protein CYMTET_26202 [Cymbomonas tetramitiformis]|uniref:Uncharacterized protein n=1 Tax=Cymbomonas tetramitiformis TaxID=36881 RepID=A0AAE0KYA4_9CHLO|nr:hypothetical protein CYMTET_26202 [Cymbomonas tetramitiformis]